MTDFIPTAEQLAIVDAAKNTTDNLILVARAGAAKTSTLVLIAEALKTTPMLCLAFNKKIQLEMKERLPSMAVPMTLNALGHRAWTEHIGKRVMIKHDKTYTILSDYIQERIDNKVEQQEAREHFAETMRMLNSAKSAGYVPDNNGFDTASPLMGDDELFAWLDPIPSELQETIIRNCTYNSIVLAFEGQCNFDDQVYMPTVFPATFPQYPLVMVDEAQDLSALNHAMLSKLVNKRLIAVGDECQAIYGFRGAHQESIDLLTNQFDMKQFKLTTSFRCSKAVIAEAKWRAPDMNAPEWAIDGNVEKLSTWDADDIPDDAAVICRNNAPLFRMAIRLLVSGRYPTLSGNELGATILKRMKKFGDASMKKAAVLEAIDDWQEKALKRTRSPGSINDQAECMVIFADQATTLGGIIAYAQTLFNASGPIQLMTGHKAKGLEFETVFFLDQHLVSDKDQDPNLRYVIITRAKNTLIYVESATFIKD